MSDPSNSGDHRGAAEATPGSDFWSEWFARHAPSARATGEQWRALAGAWQAAVDAWWKGAAAGAPADGVDAMRRCADQCKALLELGDGVARGAWGDGPRGDDAALWRLPLDMWERVTEGLAGDLGGAAGTRALAEYRRALEAYTEALRAVGTDTLGAVSDAWRARRDASGDAAGDEAGLRALFDTCVDVGERRYQELVSSDAFARTGGRLVNAFVDLIADGRGTGAAAPAARQTPSHPEPRPVAAEPDPMALMSRLGISPQTALAELRAFGDKLDHAMATLRDVGSVEVGSSARDVVLRDGKLTLYRYRATAGTTNPVPVLIVYALANRPYMLDLEPERSMIRGLLDEGLDVYLIDWGYPDRDDQNLDLADYVDDRIGRCVEAVRERHSLESISLLGVCQGGTFSLCYAALHPHRVRNLVLMVTPVDFHTPDNLLSAWLRHVDIDRLVDVMGNVPGSMLNWAFVSMKPLRLTGQKYLDMLDLCGDAEKLGTFLRMEKWIHDSPDQAGECFREFAKELMQRNRLVGGTLAIGGRRVDLGNVTMPILNIHATQDHIVPPAAVLALERHVASDDYTTYGFDGGHIGIYVSARAQREVPQAIASWLDGRRGPGTK